MQLTFPLLEKSPCNSLCKCSYVGTRIQRTHHDSASSVPHSTWSTNNTSCHRGNNRGLSRFQNQSQPRTLDSKSGSVDATMHSRRPGTTIVEGSELAKTFFPEMFIERSTTAFDSATNLSRDSLGILLAGTSRSKNSRY